MIFSTVSHQLRTNDSFRRREHPKHHTNQSKRELEKLDFDCVDQVVVEMRQILKLGIKMRLRSYSFSVPKIKRMSLALVEIRPRSFKAIEFWKATAYRSFLFYISMVAFKDVLNEERYQHFLDFCAF
jgi:hypothetical protein